MNNQEKQISEIYHCQITPRFYEINNAENYLTYKFIQKLNVNTVNLISFSFYNNFPNITPWYNQFQLRIAGKIYSVVIPKVNYSFWSIFDMITIFNTQINIQITGFGTWTFSLTGNNNKFVQLTNSSNTPFTFVFNRERNYNQLLQYIGFGEASNAFQQAFSTQVGSFPYNVQVSSNLHLCSKNMWFNSEYNACLASIPINEPITNLIQYISPFYQANRHILVKNNSQAIQDVQLACLDDLGYPLPIENNRLSVVLMFERYEQ